MSSSPNAGRLKILGAGMIMMALLPLLFFNQIFHPDPPRDAEIIIELSSEEDSQEFFIDKGDYFIWGIKDEYPRDSWAAISDSSGNLSFRGDTTPELIAWAEEYNEEEEVDGVTYIKMGEWDLQKAGNFSIAGLGTIYIAASPNYGLIYFSICCLSPFLLILGVVLLSYVIGKERRWRASYQQPPYPSTMYGYPGAPGYPHYQPSYPPWNGQEHTTSFNGVPSSPEDVSPYSDHPPYRDQPYPPWAGTYSTSPYSPFPEDTGPSLAGSPSISPSSDPDSNHGFVDNGRTARGEAGDRDGKG